MLEVGSIPKKIVIIGGGTAGWMAATSFQHAWAGKSEITLVESKDIGIIGVGEGSTPYLKQYFNRLGIAESEWMPTCDATYKAGISFPQWSTVDGYNSYFHPFFSQFDLKPAEMFFFNSNLRRRGKIADVHPEHYFVAAQIAEQYRAPVTDDSIKFEIDYGYHFDSAKLGRFLRDRAKAKGLTHKIAHISHVEKHLNQDIKSVHTSDGEELTADLFIDCSGFTGVLINKTLSVPFHSYDKQLFNNAAIALPSELPVDKPIKAQTVSTALTNGWSWEIPLTTRVGNGYVYSNAFLDADKAETELRLKLGLLESDIPARHLSMNIGRVTEHWHKNCLAVGLSQGFIEPLEATALMLIQFTIDNFIAAQNGSSQNLEASQNEYNKGINRTFDGVRDYITAHYLLNTRSDSDYWTACQNDIEVPDTLSNLLEVWDIGGDFEQALSANKDQLVYLRPSWYCILSGMGRFPNQATPAINPAPVDQAKNYCNEMAKKYFPDHLKHLKQLYN